MSTWTPLLPLLLVALASYFPSGAQGMPRRKYLCPPDFVRHGNSCYYFSAHMATWFDAHFACKDRNSELAILEKGWEDRNMRTYLNKPELARLERWIGGIYNWEIKRWVWGANGGNPLKYRGFSQMPKNSEPKWNCIIMDPAMYYKWSSRLCIEQKHYICEVPLKRLKPPQPHATQPDKANQPKKPKKNRDPNRVKKPRDPTKQPKDPNKRQRKGWRKNRRERQQLRQQQRAMSTKQPQPQHQPHHELQPQHRPQPQHQPQTHHELQPQHRPRPQPQHQPQPQTHHELQPQHRPQQQHQHQPQPQHRQHPHHPPQQQHNLQPHPQPPSAQPTPTAPPTTAYENPPTSQTQYHSTDQHHTWGGHHRLRFVHLPAQPISFQEEVLI